MTQPSAIRPREGEQPGTPFERFHAGAPLVPMPFTLDAETVEEYVALLGADAAWYRAPAPGHGPLAPVTAPALFLLTLLYRTFPPVQGLVLTHQAFDSLAPWAPGLRITGRGRIVQPEERRGRQYVSWEATFTDDASGTLLTRARNTFLLPTAERQATEPGMRRPQPAPPGGVPVTPVRATASGDPWQPGTRIACARPIAMSQALFDWYGCLNGDLDVVHYDAPYANALGYRAPIAHGLMVAGYAGELLRQVWGLPWLRGGSASFKWTAPVYPGDLVSPLAETTEARDGSEGRHLHATLRCDNGDGTPVLMGEANVPLT